MVLWGNRIRTFKSIYDEIKEVGKQLNHLYLDDRETKDIIRINS